MRRYLTLAAVLVLAVLTGVLVYQGNQPPATAGAPTATAAGQEVRRCGSGWRPGGHERADDETGRGRFAAAVHHLLLRRRRLARKWQEFLAGRGPTDSRFNGFLTGLYLLADDERRRLHRARARDREVVGRVRRHRGARSPPRIKDLNQAYAAGPRDRHPLQRALLRRRRTQRRIVVRPPTGTTSWTSSSGSSPTGRRSTAYTDVPDLTVPADSDEGWPHPVPGGDRWSN